VGEYVSETKRIEDELRNKMFMLKKAKEEAELNVRSKSEFLAYVTQEMRVPLNNIIGFAQVLKDQLYGPIENRKYRQYAADIFQTGNQLIDKMQDVLLYSKAETGYIALQERVVDVPSIINAALRQLTDKMQVEKTPVKALIQEGLPRLYVDDFRLQQVVMNLLLYALERAEAEKAIVMEVKVLTENRDRQFFVLQIALSETALHSNDALLKMATRLFAADAAYNNPLDRDRDVDLHTELGRVLVEMHGGALEVGELSAQSGAVVLLLPSLRMRFQDMADV
jgi:signal transduction histidine kinase